MPQENTNEPLCKTAVSISDVLHYPLYLNWFLVCDDYGNVLKRPKQENSCFYPDFDQDIYEDQQHYDLLKKAIIFTDFYIDEQIDELSLLRNDILEITLTVINIDDINKIRFIEANTLGELLTKFPNLKDFVREDILRLSEC